MKRISLVTLCWRLPLAVILVVPLCMLAAVTGMFIAHLPVSASARVAALRVERE